MTSIKQRIAALLLATLMAAGTFAASATFASDAHAIADDDGEEIVIVATTIN